MGGCFTPFQVIVKPVGAACNLRCHYCYYLPKTKRRAGENGARMTPDILELHIRRYMDEQPPGCPEVRFLWQGGVAKRPHLPS